MAQKRHKYRTNVLENLNAARCTSPPPVLTYVWVFYRGFIFDMSLVIRFDEFLHIHVKQRDKLQNLHVICPKSQELGFKRQKLSNRA